MNKNDHEKKINDVLEFLDSLKKSDRVSIIDDIIHRLQFERRVTLLTSYQLGCMSEELSDNNRARLDSCKNKEERDVIFKDLARTTYFRRCAWLNYLNGNTDEPPIPGTGIIERR